MHGMWSYTLKTREGHVIKPLNDPKLMRWGCICNSERFIYHLSKLHLKCINVGTCTSNFLQHGNGTGKWVCAEADVYTYVSSIISKCFDLTQISQSQ